MIVIECDGRAIVISGWRAWVIGAVALVVATIVLGAVAFLVLGIAVSVVAFLGSSYRRSRSFLRPRRG